MNFDEEIERRGDGSEKWNRYPADVLPMWIADMDFRAPQPIVDALVEKARFGIYGYQIYDELPALLADWLREKYHCEAQPEWIVPVHALVPALAQAASVRQGGVLIPVPTYMGILSAPVKTGRRATHAALKNTNESYEMDFAEMRLKADSGTETLMLCNPQNPVGRVYRHEELLEASRLANEKNLLVISDEVHSELIYEGEHIPFWTVDDYARENSITLMGPGKTCNIAGLPFGFAVIPNEAIRAAFKKAAYAISESGVMHATAAKIAYSPACTEWKRALIAYLKGNRDFLEAGLKNISSKIRFPHLEGTYLQWVDFGEVLENQNAGKWLLLNAKIAANDGNMFYGGDTHGRYDAYVRLNFAAPRSRLACALERIGNALPH
ncbi:MAG: aminotransferase class I/II-fold pyridoxal phosphate-dependent enzyme [Spirochaetaceae bacterium]|jgi:cystathionine beta-lyase|nr:aminotransferase class I/II-fold pyridoxal phosphate-dependent enzyme [Spirochaetaceae bacterium]